LRDAFIRIFNEFGQAKTQPFAGNMFASFIRNDIPSLMRGYFDTVPVNWEASAGQGRWADAPWIAAINPLITDTPQDGYYPVYLFTNSLDAVYLSLNQGMTRLVDELGVEQARETLQHRAKIIRTRLTGEYEKRFSSEPIDLQPTGPTSRLALYQPGHVFGIRYDRDTLPNNNSY